MAASYLHDHMSASGLRESVDGLVAQIKAIGASFDAIAIRGASGAIAGSAVAYALNKPLIIARKGEDCHSQNAAESPLAPRFEYGEAEARNRPIRYIVVDDLVSTGKTIRAIHAAVNKHHPGSLLIAVHCFSREVHSRLVEVDGQEMPVLYPASV